MVQILNMKEMLSMLSGHGRDQAVMDRLNEEWKRQRDIATNPIDIQNITVVEPLSSRATRDVLEALHRVYARYRSLGIPIYRLHSDRAKELISAPVRQWAAQKGLWQTSTSGDDPPSNGRIEAEIHQWKR